MAEGPIWLVGMMGAGKSAVGPRLARRLGRSFHDTDESIEREAGASIAELFANEGEAAFRARERRAIDALRSTDGVVALGGGAIAQPGVAADLASAGVIVYLKAAPETLLDRLGDCAGRPLLSGAAPEQRLARIRGLLKEREPAYETAELRVSTDGRSIDEVVEEICARLDSTRGPRAGAAEARGHA